MLLKPLTKIRALVKQKIKKTFSISSNAIDFRHVYRRSLLQISKKSQNAYTRCTSSTIQMCKSIFNRITSDESIFYRYCVLWVTASNIAQDKLVFKIMIKKSRTCRGPLRYTWKFEGFLFGLLTESNNEALQLKNDSKRRLVNPKDVRIFLVIPLL